MLLERDARATESAGEIGRAKGVTRDSENSRRSLKPSENIMLQISEFRDDMRRRMNFSSHAAAFNSAVQYNFVKTLSDRYCVVDGDDFRLALLFE